MKKIQIIKILKVTITATLIMLLSEIIFSIPQINNLFSDLVINSGNWFYLVLWIIMFLQVTILNVPAYVILSACVSIGVTTLSFEFVTCVITAYVAGAMLAYLIGYKFGTKAVKWCAGSEDDFNKWCEVLNTKGKWWYFATVILPIFPDDLLCIVCGAVKFNKFLFLVFNFIGRLVGLITILLVLNFVGMFETNFPYMIIVWSVVFVAQYIVMSVLIKKERKND